MPPTEEILAFFTVLFPTKDPEHFLAVWTLGDKTTRQFKSLADAAAFAAGSHQDTYFGVGLQSRAVPQDQRGKIEDISALSFLWLDLDYGATGHAKTNLPPDEGSAIAFLDVCGLAPTVITNSGHGIQAFWVLKEALYLDDPGERERAQRYSRLWNHTIRARARPSGWEVDSVFDLTRLMRVPGTHNYKTKPPVLARVVSASGPVYSGLTDFDPWILPEADVAAPLPVPAGSVGLDRAADPPQALFEALWANDDRFRRSWKRTRRDMQDQSSSAYDQALANVAAAASWTDQEIVDLIVASWREHADPEKPNRGLEYLTKYTIPKARQLAAEAPAAIAESLRQATPPAELPAAPPTSDNQADSSNGRAASGGGTGAQAPGGSSATVVPPPYEPTDLVMARRFVNEHAGLIRYCYPFKAWFIWDGRRWAEDETGQATEFMKATVRKAVNDAQLFHPNNTKFLRMLIRWHFAERISSCLKLAQSEPGIPVMPDALDSDLWALNCRNGIVDLRTGQLRPSDPAALMTKMVPVDYDPNARSPLWEQFVLDICDTDLDYLMFLQRAAGYSLTGDIREEKLFFAYGPKHTGKTTFLEALARTMGDYAMTADFTTFLVRDVNAIREDVARLRGARLVKSVEVAEGTKLAEGLVKQLTGGDRMAARRLHENSFEFLPQCKVWFAANNAPRARDDDEALWRRILRMPFRHSFEAGGPANPVVKAILTDPAQSGSAVLRWMVMGCLEWQQFGLPVPDVVLKETETYKTENDPLGEFFDDELVFAPHCFTTTSKLQQAYVVWARQAGIKYPLSQRSFGIRLTRKGCKRDLLRIGAHVTLIWRGVGFRAEETQGELVTDLQS